MISSRLARLTRRFRSIVPVAFLLGIPLTLAPHALAGATDKIGKIAGSVVPSDKKLSSAVYVVWTRQDALEKHDESRTGARKAGADGAFEFSDLSAGTYSICVQSQDGVYLNPCVWGERQTVEIDGKTAGKSQFAGIKISLQRGVKLQFVVEDPDSLLAESQTAATGKSLSAGVWTPAGEYIPMLGVPVNKTRWLFETVVPKNIGLHAHFRCTGIGLRYMRAGEADPELLFVDSAAGFGLMVPNKDTDMSLRFRVSAVKN
jgi:hypothetical protein